jgi:hypothetical protein
MKAKFSLLLIGIILLFTSCRIETSRSHKTVDPYNENEYLETSEDFIALAENDARYIEIAKTDPNPEVRIEAVRKIVSSSVLSDIAMNDKDPEVRMAAIGKVSSNSTLSHIASHNPRFFQSYSFC